MVDMKSHLSENGGEVSHEGHGIQRRGVRWWRRNMPPLVRGERNGLVKVAWVSQDIEVGGCMHAKLGFRVFHGLGG